jgi:hypothetical protein
MDFLRIIRSLEELLYEVMGWLVFYPRTLWRIAVDPVSMMRYSDREQADAPEKQYADTLSPPLFLMLTVLVAHGFALSMGAKLPEARTAIAKMLLSSEQNLLILRSILFSIFALVAATTLIRRQQRELDRTTLRAPFYTQCYLTAPFALAISVAATLVGVPAQTVHAVGTALTLAGIIWYVWVETRWFRLELELGPGRAFVLAVWSFLKACTYNVALSTVLLVLK